ncbi:hypothetical protein [Calothrix sp. PCC 7507]|nr:hypothetical protein [Calothrix sp. PCC 7507]
MRGFPAWGNAHKNLDLVGIAHPTDTDNHTVISIREISLGDRS